MGEGRMAFEYYRYAAGRKLRCGYTTGSCAALAAGAAAEHLLTGVPPHKASLVTPKGLQVTVQPQEQLLKRNAASCGVAKDAGDDIDATDQLVIFATVSRIPHGFEVDGGEGVGRVTKPGLDQPVGAAAINRVPRQMIAQQLRQAASRCGYTGGLRAVISVPGGEQAAKKTFNPNLGIEGGISILGTSGIVEPQSLQALQDSIATELRFAAANCPGRLILTPGNYGEAFLRQFSLPGKIAQVKCANFVGASLDLALQNGFSEILLVGHVGKLVKLAGGIMDTHSAMADCRMELFCAHAALAGADRSVCRQLMEAATTEACLDILEKERLDKTVLQSLCRAIQSHLQRRVAGRAQVGAVLFESRAGWLCQTESADLLIRNWRENA